MNAVDLVFLFLSMTPKSMAMATSINRSRLGAIIAQKRIQRAREMMLAFRHASINPKKD